MKYLRMSSLLIATVLLASCGEDGVITDPPPVPEGFPEAEVAAGVAGLDQLAENLEQAWAF